MKGRLDLAARAAALPHERHAHQRLPGALVAAVPSLAAAVAAVPRRAGGTAPPGTCRHYAG